MRAHVRLSARARLQHHCLALNLDNPHLLCAAPAETIARLATLGSGVARRRAADRLHAAVRVLAMDPSRQAALVATVLARCTHPGLRLPDVLTCTTPSAAVGVWDAVVQAMLRLHAAELVGAAAPFAPL